MTGADPAAARLLLVEGQDDKHVLWQICRKDSVAFSVRWEGYDMSVTLRSTAAAFAILEKGNSHAVLEAIETEIFSRGRQALGIVVDADRQPEQRWEELKDAFPAAVPLPDAPDPAGIVLPEQLGQPRIGVWMMPDNRSPGELEDFVKQMIPPAAPVWAAAQRYIDDIQPDDRKFAPEKTDKAKLYAWLSTLKEPARMGAAIGDGDLQTTGPLCQTFVHWLQRLFG